MPNFKTKLLIILIFAAGLLLRVYRYNWDDHTHLHPDERFLTMVSTDIKIPNSISQYFDTSSSSLNPTNNPNYRFFVYGTFPIFLTRLVAEQLEYTGYDQIYLLGRIFSAIFDAVNILSLYFLARLILKRNKLLQILPSLLYAFCVLPLQLSHYYAVDTFLTSFILLSFVFLSYSLIPACRQAGHNTKYLILISAFFFGLALSSKITAVLFLPVIGLLLIYPLITKKISFIRFLISGFSFLAVFLLTFRVFQPYAFTGLFNINPLFIENFKTLASQSNPDIYFPPSVQWLSKTKLIFPAQNILFWGIGIPFFIFTATGLILFLSRIRKISFFDEPHKFIILMSFLWVILLFFYQGLQTTYAMRYFLPIYPFIFLLSSLLLSVSMSKHLNIFLYIFLFLHVLWGISFLSIYTRPQTRIQASYSMYQSIPPGSNLTNEYWDDPLPLYLPGGDPYTFKGQMLSLYDPDTPEKWAKINPIIDNADYMVMSSNRLWGSITRVPQYYPETSVFYNKIFDNQTNFKLASKFVSYPGFILPFITKCYYFGPTDYPYKTSSNSWFEIDPHCNYPGFYFRDDTADESFTVYDHPQVLIWQRQ